MSDARQLTKPNWHVLFPELQGVIFDFLNYKTLGKLALTNRSYSTSHELFSKVLHARLEDLVDKQIWCGLPINSSNTPEIKESINEKGQIVKYSDSLSCTFVYCSYQFYLDIAGSVWVKTRRGKLTVVPGLKNIYKMFNVRSGLPFFVDYAGKMFTFGEDENMELHRRFNNFDVSGWPVSVMKNITNIKFLLTRKEQAFIVDGNGNVWVFGDNYPGGLGVKGYEFYFYPIKIENLENVEYVYSNGRSTFFVTKYNTIFACGHNESWQLGGFVKKPLQIEPVSIAYLDEKIKTILVANNGSCIVSASGEMFVAGANFGWCYNYHAFREKRLEDLIKKQAKILNEHKVPLSQLLSFAKKPKFFHFQQSYFAIIRYLESCHISYRLFYLFELNDSPWCNNYRFLLLFKQNEQPIQSPNCEHGLSWYTLRKLNIVKALVCVYENLKEDKYKHFSMFLIKVASGEFKTIHDFQLFLNLTLRDENVFGIPYNQHMKELYKLLYCDGHLFSYLHKLTAFFIRAIKSTLVEDEKIQFFQQAFSTQLNEGEIDEALSSPTWR